MTSDARGTSHSIHGMFMIESTEIVVDLISNKSKFDVWKGKFHERMYVFVFESKSYYAITGTFGPERLGQF